MLSFWNNPEFVRHRRAELRPSRMVTVLVVAVMVCLLTGLACWSAYQERVATYERVSKMDHPDAAWLARLEPQSVAREFWRVYCVSLVMMQLALLTFWSLLAGAQGISGERERKTWDFQRTTRLTSWELTLGKLLGGPVLAYFIVLICMPMTLLAGLKGALGPWNMISIYLVLLSSGLFIGLCGLWISSLLESRGRGVGVVGAVGIYGLMSMFMGMRNSILPGLSAFNPLTALTPLSRIDDLRGYSSPVVFGHAVSWLAMTLLLYTTFGAWLVLMLVRNLKRDLDQVRPLSRWQAVGCAAFLNFVVYALFDPHGPDAFTNPHEFIAMMVGVNTFVLFAVGLATLSPHERLKVWWRQRQAKQASLFAEDGLPWPWMALSAVVAFALLIWGTYAWGNAFTFDRNMLGAGAVQLLCLLIFITRDILFLQWCRLTRLRSPLMKGVLFLLLYYASVGVIYAVLRLPSASLSDGVANLLTPVGAFDIEATGFHFARTVFLGLGLQLMVIGLLLSAIARRLRRPAMVLAMAGD